MLKNISTLGKALNRTEQQSINGGRGPICEIVYRECDACHPDDYGAFVVCITNLGCGLSANQR